MEEETARNLTAGSGGCRPGLGDRGVGHGRGAGHGCGVVHGRGAGHGHGAGHVRGVGHGRGAGGTRRGLERLLWTGWTPGGRIFIGVNF